jgi:hypothetical protein
MPDIARGVAISGDYAYVADYGSGLQVIDISDPTSPTLAGSYDTPGNAYDVAISGNYAYVADEGSGLQVIDISDPTNPAPIGSYDTLDGAYAVGISGEYAYVAASFSGLQVIRIADPVLPPELAGSYDTPGAAQGVATSGDYAYVAATASGVQVIDINDPTTPTFAGSYDTPGIAGSVAVAGDLAFVADGDPGLQVIDISDPTNPTLLGTYDTPSHAYEVAVSGDHAYVADYLSGLQVIDISDATNPTFAGSYDTPDEAWGVAVAGNYAYVANRYTGLLVIDISDPTSPVLAGSYDTPGKARRVAIAGNYAYVADAGDPAGSLQVVDVSDPASPVLAGSYDTTPHEVFSIAISGDYAYLGETSSLQVFDISDPTSPVPAGGYDTPSTAIGVAISGDYAYAAASGPLQVIQVFQRTMDLTGDVGQSFDVSSYNSDIMEAKLATTQTDTITWEMSADGGSNWQGVLPDGEWNPLAYTGNDFRWRSTHTAPNLYTNPACASLQFDFMFEFPQVDVVEDIPNDQGRQVSISWTRSGNDFAGSGTPITEYAIYREVDPDLTAAQAFLEQGDKSIDPRYRVDGDPIVASLPPGSWHFIMTVPALTEDNYAAVVPTLADSTIAEGMYTSTFIVLALTATPGVHFESPPDSGYSLDNLAPSIPEGFLVAYNAGGGNQLSWEPASAEDFRYCCIYRSTNPDFTPDPGNLVKTTVADEWLDPVSEGWQYYYKLSAVDFSGNESDPTGPGTATGIVDKIIPKTFGLTQNVPNPFNPTTVIHYEVPELGGHVTLRIYDVAGRVVRTLVDGQQVVGEKRVTWNGRDDRGSRVATGVYFYRMTAPGYEKTLKMVLVQ